MSDLTVHRLGYAAMLLVSLIAAAVSFIHIVALARGYGQPQLAAYLLPVSIDGEVAACSLALLRAARLDLAPPWLAQAGVVSGVLATLACNVGFGLTTSQGRGTGHEITGSLLSGWPALAFIICAELAIGMVRKVARKRVPRPVPATVAEPPARPVTEPGPAGTAPAVAQPVLAGGRKRGTEPAGFPAAVEAVRVIYAAGQQVSLRQIAADHLDGNRHAAARAQAAALNGASHG
jgi:hypothetical protein